MNSVSFFLPFKSGIWSFLFNPLELYSEFSVTIFLFSGFVVLEAGDGQEAIIVLDANPELKMVLCDLRMPNMDGLEFLDAVRDRGLSVVMMSAYGTSETTDAALALGAVDTISKPFRPSEIKLRLERLILARWIAILWAPMLARSGVLMRSRWIRNPRMV